MINEAFSADDIKKHLKKETDIKVFDCLESTNLTLKELAACGAPEGTAVIARRQTAGRGRLGRQFYSPESGLYLSLLLRPDDSPEAALLITAAAAVSVAQAIEKICGKHCGIKWVNDIFLDGKKICGILTEGALCGEKLDFAILGIGINITAPKGGFPEELKDIAGAIYSSAPPPDTSPWLAAEVINIFFDYYKDLQSRAYLSEYRTRSVLTGKEITYPKAGENRLATVIGIDDNAGLVIEGKGKRLTLSAGEVSVKLK